MQHGANKLCIFSKIQIMHIKNITKNNRNKKKPNHIYTIKHAYDR